MKSKVAFLKQVPLFSSLGYSDLEDIAAIAKRRKIGKREVIFTQGDPGDALFVLTSGAVKVSLIGVDGRETMLKILYTNDFFGEMSLLDGHHRSATVTTLELVDVLTISRSAFTNLIKKNPCIILNITTLLCHRLRRTSEQVARLTFFSASSKVAHTLLELSNSKGRRENRPTALTVRFGRQELANLTAVSRETLSRVLYDLQDKGYLRLEGKEIIILKESLLKEEVIDVM